MEDGTFQDTLCVRKLPGQPEYIINVDDALGKVLTTPPVDSIRALNSQRLPDGRYRCALTPQIVTVELAVILNGRLIVAEGAAQCLRDFMPRYFHYVPLKRSRRVLVEFGQLLSSSYWLKLKQLAGSPDKTTARNQFFMEILRYKVLTKEVARWINGSYTPPVPENIETLQSLRSQFETIDAIREYQDQVFARLRELMRKFRFGVSTDEDRQQYTALTYETVGLSILIAERQ